MGGPINAQIPAGRCCRGRGDDLPVMALAENDQFNPEQNTSVVGGSNSSTVKEPEGSTVKEPEGAANKSKVPETGKPIVSAEDAAVTERLPGFSRKKAPTVRAASTGSHRHR